MQRQTLEIPAWARLISAVEALGLELAALEALVGAHSSGGFDTAILEEYFSVEVVDGVRVLLATAGALCNFLGDSVVKDRSQAQVRTPL